MQTMRYSKASIFALLAFGAWTLTAVGLFLPWVTVTVKICEFIVCLPVIEIYSSHSSLLQLLVPIDISQFLPTINHYVTSLIISNFFPTFNQYLADLSRAAQVLLGSVIALLFALSFFAVKSRGGRPPDNVSAAISLLAALIGLAAVYGTVQTLTAIQQHVKGAHTELGAGFWMVAVGLVLVVLIMLLQLLISLRSLMR